MFSQLLQRLPFALCAARSCCLGMSILAPFLSFAGLQAQATCERSRVVARIIELPLPGSHIQLLRQIPPHILPRTVSMVTQTNIHKVCCKNCAIKKMFVCIFTRNLFKAATECSQPPLQRYGVFGDHWKLPNPAKDLAKETLPDISSCNWNQITGNSMMRPTTLLCSHMAYA